jgi:hypothetical protein
MATIINLKHRHIFGYHILIWWNAHSEFKLLKIDNRMYKKYSLYIGRFIFEIGTLKYGTNNKSVSTINK